MIELIGVDEDEMLDLAYISLIETCDDLCQLVALRSERNADRTAVDARSLVFDESEIYQLLQIV
ncbi:hypothetical protein, partial [Mesorhizobium japonicum]|uniref:hypothetical protein n=1 Tax=Mesorhizobium japonicum TaxID=2066070 RepID=UPI003B5A8F4E